jgi:hypothetical protein
MTSDNSSKQTFYNLEKNDQSFSISSLETTKKKSLMPRKSLKALFLNWSRQVDINGYNKIFEYRHNFSIQLIWTVILIASTCATFWIVSKNVTGYLSYEIVSQISLLNEIPATFPTITICNNDPFTNKLAEKLYDEVVNKTNYTRYTKDNVDVNLNNLVLMWASNPAFGDENRLKLGFNKSIIFSCKFKKKNCLNDFHWHWSYLYGNCWQFNSGLNSTNHKISIKNSTVEGREDGLSICLFPLVNNNQYMTTWDSGMVMFIHNNQFKPLLTDAVYLEPGKTSFVSVKRTITHRYPRPYSNCIDLTLFSSDFYNIIKNSGEVYRQSDCIKLCKQQQIIAKCGCYSLEFQNLDNFTNPCSNLTQYSCIGDQKSNFDLSDCQANSCPLECDSIKYDLAISTLANPDLKEYYTLTNKSILDYSLMHGKNLNYDLFQSMWVNVKVFYPSFEYTEITQTPKTTIFDLFTQIGGSLGLFISFSVYTLFEIGEIFFIILYGWFKANNEKNKHETQK